MNKYILLGAEKQAAVSAAQAWPDRHFIFFTDQPIIDGWDLPNVEIFKVDKPCYPQSDDFESDHHLPLCPRWINEKSKYPLNKFRRFELLTVMNYLSQEFSDIILPVYDQPPKNEDWIRKGNLFHHPDEALTGKPLDVISSYKAYECGTVFQKYLDGTTDYVVTGNRTNSRSISLAVFLIHRQAFGREDFLFAGETVYHPLMIDKSVAALSAMNHLGFFTFNWIEQKNNYFISSFRPVPKGVFGVFTKSGIDCLSISEPGVHIARSGIKYIATPTYSSYKRL
ncbi:MAG: hypothetical protein HF978_14460 [Desulfobacteraceae bacterium]|nr:hypothetical protein [Desulfobacteraceae bacterium]MBC2756742.1 hypothetical protein [Desulfobacteraceae bacterium]